jgi:hypothetical protein
MAVQYAFAKIVTDGLALAVDAADPNSYPGTGTTWRDITPNNNSGTITGSIAYSTAYKGGFVFSGPTASVTFSTASANFGTGSFTVEMAFQPDRIQGIHYLASKNSGSFPNWGIYLSGSNGSGKLFSEFRISSTVSSSISSSTTFVTGSVYQVDVRIAPLYSASGFSIDGIPIGGATGSAGGSLTNTGSLFLGNSAVSSSQAFSGSIYAVKLYSVNTIEQPTRNFNAIAPRFSKPLITDTAKKQFELLVIAGGGGGGRSFGGGGGAGGLITSTTTNFTAAAPTTVIVGSGGASSTNGQDSSVSSYIAIGGGSGGQGSSPTTAPGNGGSGGGCGIGTTIPGTGTVGQGNAGGSSSGNNAQSDNNTGGGGGAGEAGRDYNASSRNGQGGSGSFIASFAAIGGSPAGWFSGGGGGGFNSKLGGIGGGGNSLDLFTIGGTGSINTGGGGGGGSNGGSAGGAGGSGIVAIRYSGGPIALGGEITQSAGFTYHVFRTVGTSSFTIF